MTREYHISKLTFLKIFGLGKKFRPNFQHFFRNFKPKITEIVSETQRSPYDPHYKVVELAEISRLRYSNVKSDVGNKVI